MILLALSLAAALALVLGRALAEALRSEHLVVLHWRRHGTWIFERGADGRYQRLDLRSVPGAVIRFVRTQRSPVPATIRTRGPRQARAPAAA